MKLYHATDISCVQSILDKGFICRKNREHWLGNGIYFYRDYDLAKWWATNPTNKFGVKIQTFAVLSIDLDVPKENLLDLSVLSDYTDCVEAYEEFSGYVLPSLVNGDYQDRKCLRCAFFDWIFETREVNCIIGGFSHENKAYLRSSPVHGLKQMRIFDLPYIETQVCVRPEMIDRNKISVVPEGDANK